MMKEAAICLDFGVGYHRLRRIKTVEMAGFVDGDYSDLIVRHVYFVDAARSLRQSPIGGKRKVCELHEKRAIYAVV